MNKEKFNNFIERAYLLKDKLSNGMIIRYKGELVNNIFIREYNVDNTSIFFVVGNTEYEFKVKNEFNYINQFFNNISVFNNDISSYLFELYLCKAKLLNNLIKNNISVRFEGADITSVKINENITFVDGKGFDLSSISILTNGLGHFSIDKRSELEWTDSIFDKVIIPKVYRVNNCDLKISEHLYEYYKNEAKILIELKNLGFNIKFFNENIKTIKYDKNSIHFQYDKSKGDILSNEESENRMIEYFNFIKKIKPSEMKNKLTEELFLKQVKKAKELSLQLTCHDLYYNDKKIHEFSIRYNIHNEPYEIRINFIDCEGEIFNINSDINKFDDYIKNIKIGIKNKICLDTYLTYKSRAKVLLGLLQNQVEIKYKNKYIINIIVDDKTGLITFYFSLDGNKVSFDTVSFSIESNNGIKEFFDSITVHPVVPENKNMTQKELNTKMIEACSKGDFETAKLLIKDGADINAVNDKECLSEQGCSALHYATYKNNFNFVKFLLDSGIDKNIRANSGCLATQNCINLKNKEMQNFIENYKKGNTYIDYEYKVKIQVVVPENYKLKHTDPQEIEIGADYLGFGLLNNFIFDTLVCNHQSHHIIGIHPILGTKRFIVEKIKTDLELQLEKIEYAIEETKINIKEGHAPEGSIKNQTKKLVEEAIKYGRMLEKAGK